MQLIEKIYPILKELYVHSIALEIARFPEERKSENGKRKHKIRNIP